MQLHVSDLEKIHDALAAAYRHNKARDEMNASQHLAGQVRWSPLTTVLEFELDRCARLIEELRDSSPNG